MDMCRSDLSFNHQYFNTKKGHYWSEIDNEALSRGLKKHPVGEWKRINDEEFGGKVSPVLTVEVRDGAGAADLPDAGRQRSPRFDGSHSGREGLRQSHCWQPQEAR